MHIGKKISEILSLKRMTRQELGKSLGISGSAVTYLTTRASIDVRTLAAIGNVLHYNFFQHYPVKDSAVSKTDPVTEELNRQIEELKTKNAELEKKLEAGKRDLMIQKQENGYLKKINELLEKK